MLHNDYSSTVIATTETVNGVTTVDCTVFDVESVVKDYTIQLNIVSGSSPRIRLKKQVKGSGISSYIDVDEEGNEIYLTPVLSAVDVYSFSDSCAGGEKVKLIIEGTTGNGADTVVTVSVFAPAIVFKSEDIHIAKIHSDYVDSNNYVNVNLADIAYSSDINVNLNAQAADITVDLNAISYSSDINVNLNAQASDIDVNLNAQAANIDVNLATKLAGEDVDQDRLLIEERFTQTRITTNTTTVVCNGSGILKAVVIEEKGHADEVIKIYDNTAGSGTVLAEITVGDFGSRTIDLVGIAATTGITVVTSGTTAGKYSIIFRENI